MKFSVRRRIQRLARRVETIDPECFKSEGLCAGGVPAAEGGEGDSRARRLERVFGEAIGARIGLERARLIPTAPWSDSWGIPPASGF